jgi:hypothetical protein
VTLRQRVARINRSSFGSTTFRIARALARSALDIDVKLRTLHLHSGRSAIPLASLAPSSTKSITTLL